MGSLRIKKGAVVGLLGVLAFFPVDQACSKSYALVWGDEFHQAIGSAPDPTKWTYDLGAGGWGNEELETYTRLPQNASIVADPLAGDGEALRIQALKGSDGTYTSARLTTKGKVAFKYGWVECRARLPYGQGIWPAFWMLGNNFGKVGWPGCGEMDVMENIGKIEDQGRCHGTLHGPGFDPDKGLTAVYKLPKGRLFKDAYHVFALEWTPKLIRFYVDKHLYASRKLTAFPTGAAAVFDKPFFLLLNLAVGGDWPGNPDSTTVFPQALMVDYVRVYQLQ